MRITKTVEIPRVLLERLKEELDTNKDLIASVKDGMTYKHKLFMAVMSTLVDCVDPRFNSGDHTIADFWYRLEWEATTDEEEFEGKMDIIEGLLRFGYAKVADIGRREENKQNGISAAYDVTDVSADIVVKVSEALPSLIHALSGEITATEMREIKKYSILVEAIDARYTAQHLSRYPISIAEKWYAALYTEDDVPIDEKEYTEAYTTLLSILWALVHTRKCKILYSSTGMRMYNKSIHEEYTDT